MTTPGGVVPNDPFGTIKDDKKEPEAVMTARQSQLAHARSDVDSGQFAQHHTLGTKHNQSSPGDHIHDGSDSRLIGKGKGLSVTGSKGGNVALTNLINMLKQVIDFNDTTS